MRLDDANGVDPELLDAKFLCHGDGVLKRLWEVGPYDAPAFVGEILVQHAPVEFSPAMRQDEILLTVSIVCYIEM